MRLITRILSWGLFALAGGALVVYGVGRVLTDRFEWSQFLFWLPGWALGVAGLATWGAAAGLSFVNRRGGTGEGPARGSRAIRVTRLGVGAGIALCLLHTGWHARLYRDLRPAGGAGAPIAGDATLRVFHWNAMAPDVVPRDDTLQPLLNRYEPDLMLLSMALAPHQYDGLVSKLPAEFESLHLGLFTVVTRLHVLETRVYTLGLAQAISGSAKWNPSDPRSQPPSPDEQHHWVEYVYNAVGPRLGLPRRYFRNADPGSLLVITLDGGSRFGRPITVYYIDLPSDPLRPKNKLAAQVGAELAEIQRESGAKPDFIVGDFNIPRDSASLGRITGGMRSAFDDAGTGLFATWPRTHPVLHLDQFFRSAAWRAVKYERLDPGSGDHMAHFIELVAIGAGR